MLVALVVVTGCGNTAPNNGPDAGTDAGSGGSTGTGGNDGGFPDCEAGEQCVPGPAAGWDYPALVWIGDEQSAPSCPAGAPKDSYEGRADLDAPLDCGTCTCTPPIGSCSLPKSMTANAASCAQNGSATPHTPFDPSSGWDGSCDTNESIPSGKLCSGVKCVQSLTIEPVTVSDGECTPSQPPSQSQPAWKTFARGCKKVPPVPCQGGASICVGVPPPGFRVCIFNDGDRDCSAPWFAPYTEKHVFYQHFQDTRACSPCSCGTPSGSSCSSTISVFTDGACSALAYSTMVTSAGPACHDLPAGTPLGSKSATPPTYTPGACTPGGGEPMGAAVPVQPSTYCCIPLP